MNDEEKLRLEEQLKRAAPLMSRLSGPTVVPDRIKKRLDAALEKKFPLVRELTEKQMETLLLKIIAEQPADGFELTNQLSKAKFKLKDEGEGAIYGILSRLENNGLIEGRWRESSASMRKSYYLTETGTKLVKKQYATAGEMQGWVDLILQRG